jgi:hypothetical protein
MFVSYPAVGIYRVKVKLTPTVGPVVQSWFDFQANKAFCASCLYKLEREIPLQDPASTFLASSAHSGGKITFIPSVNNLTGRVKKPLIILKGFDIFSSAPHLVKNHRYDMSDLIKGINNSTFDGFDFNVNLDNIASYDIVLINYNNATDDIKRNALLLQAVIRRVNIEKAANGSTEQNVVMGMSMGGLIARFGLAQMVRNGENPQTRLLITHDSPHRGANVPLAFQFFGRYAITQGISSFSGTILAQDILPRFLELNNFRTFALAK